MDWSLMPIILPCFLNHGVLYARRIASTDMHYNTVMLSESALFFIRRWTNTFSWRAQCVRPALGCQISQKCRQPNQSHHTFTPLITLETLRQFCARPSGVTWKWKGSLWLRLSFSVADDIMDNKNNIISATVFFLSACTMHVNLDNDYDDDDD